MSLVSSSKIYFYLILSLIVPVSAHALPAITCHCFTDRSFDVAHPAAADSYFLATTQNSFFAIVFNTDKKTVVMKKQQGTSPDDLWIAYRVASHTGETADSLLRAKAKSDSWQQVVAALRLPSKNTGTRFSSALNANVAPGRMSEAVVDDIFITGRLLGEWELADVRKAGASNQELIIATVIATKTRRPAKQLYLEVKAGARTWGSLLTDAKIDPKNMQKEISSILKLSRLYEKGQNDGIVY